MERLFNINPEKGIFMVNMIEPSKLFKSNSQSKTIKVNDMLL
jgi:hypothetical protein